MTGQDRLPPLVKIVDPLDGAVFDAPVGFLLVQIWADPGSEPEEWEITKVELEIDGILTGVGCQVADGVVVLNEAGMCNIVVADLLAGEHVLTAVATAESLWAPDYIWESWDVTITVQDAGATESGATETGTGTATATETETASEASGAGS